MKRARQLPLTPSQRARLGIAAAVIAGVLLLLGAYRPAIAHIGARRAVLDELRAKVAAAQARIAQIPDPERAWEEAQERYRSLERRFGEGQSVARILEALSQQAKDHRLDLVAVQPRTEAREPRMIDLGSNLTLREVPLTLTLTGRYRQLGEFLRDLVHAPFITSVRRLHVTKPLAASAALQAELVLAVHLSTSDTRP